ncbi:SUMF1/EgtB/PvdO family nonheme iron enzyme [Pendulispora albinea]|uniref:Formylglycine-generating enzyme family protein n=1 Tax=Pendulispora albinea TaxID=2741071 RepID=A0ABZ2LR18_9BACT
MSRILGACVFAGVLSLSAPALPRIDESQAAEGVHGALAKRCPSEMTLVGQTCVDRYEASLVEVLEDGTEVPFSPYEIPKRHRVRAVSRAGVVPQAYTSMYEAQRACGASGKRLCHGREWKAACRGPDNTRYPYGPSRVKGACVDTHRVSPIMKLFGGGHFGSQMNDPRLNQLEGTVAPTGTATACTNHYGVHDMVGNLHEWTDDGIFRGGYYLDTEINGEGCDYVTAAHIPAYHDYSTGFRCCADADSLPIEEEEPPPSSSDKSQSTPPDARLAARDAVETQDDHAPPTWDLGASTTRALAPRPRRSRRRR